MHVALFVLPNLSASPLLVSTVFRLARTCGAAVALDLHAVHNWPQFYDTLWACGMCCWFHNDSVQFTLPDQASGGVQAEQSVACLLCIRESKLGSVSEELVVRARCTTLILKVRSTGTRPG
jgi:hypothetical protein